MVKIPIPNKVFLICSVVGIALIVLGVIIKDTGVLGNFTIIAAFVIVAPQFFLRYKKFREIREMEEKFPSFLRDLIESVKAGMPFHKAIISNGVINYGSLSKEVKKMADQLSWGISLDRVLEQFSERIKSSKRLYLATKVIRECYLSGGNVISTLDSLVENQITLVEASKEKSSMLNQYVVLMYAITIIFLVIVVSINKFMAPIFETSQEIEGFGMGNPCINCGGLECSICGLTQGSVSKIFGIDPTTPSAFYIAIFFFMAMIQAFFAGLVAGQLSEGSLIAGLRHSIILIGIVFGVFSILIKMKVIGA